MKKKILLFLFTTLISFYFFSCKKEIIKPTINHVNFSENIVQIDFDNKPSFDLSYSKNNVINGEISLQLLDETGTILHFLPNSNLLNENGKIRINNVSNLIDGEKYFLKIENCNHNNSYYNFLIGNDTSYHEVLFIPFNVSINKNISNVFIETFNMIITDDFGPQLAVKYGANINNNSIIIKDLNIYIYSNENPWDMFEYMYIRDVDDFLITSRFIGYENNWIKHNDSTFQLYLNGLYNNVDVGEYVRKIQFETSNCIDPTNMLIKIKSRYYDKNDIKVFETRMDSIKIINP